MEDYRQFVQVSFRLPGEFAGALRDAVAGSGLSKNAWLVRAVEQALEAGRGEPGRPEMSSTEPRVVGSLPAPAEQPEGSAKALYREPVRDLVRPAREFRPYPKGGG